ncbi:MAG TPA: hypothetical protein VJP80_00395, partial [Candidatus Saccharimonadales bacterium]|nr:hypothetical protein [Candidatus Saccharimonadales bacterium]
SFFYSMGGALPTTNGAICWVIDGGGTGAGGNASSTWRDTYCQGTATAAGGGGNTGQIAYRASGAYVSDLYFSNASSAEANYGYYFDYSTAASGGYADVIVDNPVVDGITAQGIFVNALPAQQMITISNGWFNPVSMLAETDAIYVNNSIGAVQIKAPQIGGEANYAYAVGVKSVSSSNVKVLGGAFIDNKYAIQETGSTGNVYTANSVYNTSAHAGSVDILVTGGHGTIISHNTLSGYSSFGVQVDATSDSVATNNNTVNGGNITTPVQNNGTNPIGYLYTGSGAIVLQTAPTLTTPVITGVTNGSAAASGQVGQPISNSSTGTTITSGTTVNATSISVPAGDWNCWGQALFLPTSSTVVANIAAGLGTTSATLPASPNTTYLGTTLTSGANGVTSLNPTTLVENVSTATTLYLTAEAGSVTGG